MKTIVKTPELPAGILASDIKRPAYGSKAYVTVDYEGNIGKGYSKLSFDLWFTTGFGWCIPTLMISRGRNSREYGERTYATRVSNSELVSIGNGPHVTFRTTCYVRKARMAKLEKYVKMAQAGKAEANVYRDRLSSRRARTSARRFAFGY